MILYYIFSIYRLLINNNIQNQFIRFSFRNIFYNYKNKFIKNISKLNKYNYLFNIFYTKPNNDTNYEDIQNFIKLYIHNNYDFNKKTKNNIDNKIIKNYLD